MSLQSVDLGAILSPRTDISPPRLPRTFLPDRMSIRVDFPPVHHGAEKDRRNVISKDFVL